MNDKSQVNTHSGDCHWWTYHVCDCGWLMRAHSGDCGPPSDEIVRDFAEHSRNCQRAAALTHDRAELSFLQDQLTQAQAELAKFHEAMERERGADWERWHKALAYRLENPGPDPTIKYFEQRLGTPGEHSTAETVDNIVIKLNHQQERIKALEGELALANDCVKGLEGNLKALEGELDQTKLEVTRSNVALAHAQNRIEALQPSLDQAHAALKLAHSTLLLFKPSKHQWASHSGAIAAIKACGVME